MWYIKHIIAAIILTMTAFAQVQGKSGSDTVTIYFRLDEADISANNVRYLDSLSYEEVLSPGKSYIIVGYADYVGDETYNKELSEKRALNVQQYLSELGIKKTNIKMCLGKGEVNRLRQRQGGYAIDRRVDIIPESPNAIKLANIPLQKIGKAPIDSVPSEPQLLINVPVGQTLALNSIYFYTGRHMVRDESLPELAKLYNTLKNNPTLRIRIEGHVCCVPAFTDALDEDTFEYALSINRAKYIYQYLIDRGIHADRLSYAGFGHRKPRVVKELTAADENTNRRVELRVIER